MSSDDSVDKKEEVVEPPKFDVVKEIERIFAHIKEKVDSIPARQYTRTRGPRKAWDGEPLPEGDGWKEESWERYDCFEERTFSRINSDPHNLHRVIGFAHILQAHPDFEYREVFEKALVGVGHTNEMLGWTLFAAYYNNMTGYYHKLFYREKRKDA